MGTIELLVLAVGLAMDAFAVSVCKGLAMGRPTWRQALIPGLWFGGFQGLMPCIGWLLGAPVGIGTLIAVFGLGTVMQMVFQVLHFEPRDITQTGFIEAIQILLKGE